MGRVRRTGTQAAGLHAVVSLATVTDDVQRFRAAHVVTPAGVLDDAVVEVRGDRVASVHPNGGDERAEGLGGWVVPGFVDPHVHGGGGHDYATTDPAEAAAAVAGESSETQ